jgi:hypothetical protein
MPNSHGGLAVALDVHLVIIGWFLSLVSDD